MHPGRSCPLHYRYAPSVLAREPDLIAETLYVVGGLYGNRPALAALLDLAAREPGPVTLVFNGDFNWFNVDPEGFSTINRQVLQHTTLRGNVETEIADDDDSAGCGCGYPAWVSDAEVARSDEIITRLRAAARAFPALRERLAMLPMHLVAEVGGVRTAIVHGDAHSLAGWDFAQEALSDPAHRARIASEFAAANTRIFASSHTCLPVAHEFDTPQGACALINNGAAGMPNFSGAHFGVITRLATSPARHVEPLYTLHVDAIHVEALPLHYDHTRWLEEFLANWPAGSPAHASYYRRITAGPAHTVLQAVRSPRKLQTTTAINRSSPTNDIKNE
ncbi:MAG: hypothetical protein AABZ67_17150 [Pseudomonadota bacterium]